MVAQSERALSELLRYVELAAKGSGQSIPSDWDGRLESLSPHRLAGGYLIDSIMLGPTPLHANKFEIYDYHCIAVDGFVPSICPTALPKPQAAWLPQIERRFRDLGLVVKGQTIHWVGDQSSPDTICSCPGTVVGTPAVSTVQLYGYGNHDDADPIEQVLHHQPLMIYRILRDRKHFTSYATLREDNTLWRSDCPSDDAIHRALRRLQEELNGIAAAPHLVIENKTKRVRLDKGMPQ